MVEKIVKKSSVLNITARGVMEQRIPEESISMMNLLNRESLDKIAENAGTSLEGLRNIRINQCRCS